MQGRDLISTSSISKRRWDGDDLERAYVVYEFSLFLGFKALQSLPVCDLTRKDGMILMGKHWNHLLARTHNA